MRYVEPEMKKVELTTGDVITDSIDNLTPGDPDINWGFEGSDNNAQKNV